MADDPGDPGFTDIGDLGTESQAAIAQLADLGITRGTSDTTYSPADNVTRAEMALFISRTMNLMDPLADGEIGLSSTTQYGYTPSDVDDNDMDADIGSPFTDLGRSSKDEHDAIENLYELGVASGISDTSYSALTNITRAVMAEFMAAALDHSNARPAGLSIQSSTAEGWGTQEPTILVSVRDDSFAPTEDQSVDIFSSASPSNMGLRKDGTCNFNVAADPVFAGDLSVEGDCEWNDNDEATDANGNIIVGGEVDEGSTRVFYAWIGSKDGEKFDADDADEVLVSVKAKREQETLKGSSDINEHALNVGFGQQVDLRNGRDVVVTAQLKDTNSKDVERAGISIRVEYRQGGIALGARDSRAYVNTHEATLVTDDDGSVQLEVSSPANSRGDDEREDSVVFIELDADGATTGRESEVKIHWIEETPVLSSDSIDAPVYVLEGEPTVSTTVRLWDQYGDSIRSHSRQQVRITYTDSEDDDDATVKPAVRQVISRGYARWSTKVEVEENNTVTVTYDVRQLARNSSGTPVRLDGADNAAMFTAWLGIEATASSATRQNAIDALLRTYNDGSVITEAANEAGEFLNTLPLYRHLDDDNDPETPEATDDDDPDNDDPLQVIVRAGAEQALRRIINDHGTDTYVDRGEAYSGVDMTDMQRRAVTTAAVVDPIQPTDMDHEGTGEDSGKVVQVVDEAVSTNVGNDVLNITNVLVDDNQFLTDSADDEDTPELVYTYDDDDIFIDSTDDNEAQEVDIDTFEAMIVFDIDEGDEEVYIQVIAYDIDGTSIFRVHSVLPTS